eukprot:TRINITY_DN1683_c2_g1_i1.p1 TRINITY_DN1683_c2_g1~~TRINITY_DN1683_c2_g1_i1.p1  ORF type:complete len:253 (-),score=118.12 TRINITY_DN1683_c2_g1_i1:84-800(-)
MSKKPDDSYEYLFKIVMLGDSAVGKSNLVLRFTQDQFTADSKSTIGVEFSVQTLDIKGRVVKAQLWDTAGQERYRSIMHSYYRGAFGAIVVYDVTNVKSFDHVQNWLQQLREYANPNVVVMLVGNKIDLKDQRTVQIETAQEFATQYNALFMETSALTAENVQAVFQKLLTEIYERMEQRNAIMRPSSKQTNQVIAISSTTTQSTTNDLQETTPKSSPLALESTTNQPTKSSSYCCGY